MAKAKKQDNVTEPTDPKPAKAAAKKAEAAPPAPVETAGADSKGKKPAKAKATAKAEAPAAEVKAETPKPTAAAPAKAPTKAASKSAPATQKPATPVGSKPAFPGIDTNLAARAAANLVANRDLLSGLNLTPTAAAGQPKPVADTAKPESKVESTSFKNLKQNLAQPTAGLNKMLGFSNNPKKSGLPFGGSGPGGGKGQSSGGTGGGNKLGVPRRTSGG